VHDEIATAAENLANFPGERWGLPSNSAVICPIVVGDERRGTYMRILTELLPSELAQIAGPRQQHRVYEAASGERHLVLAAFLMVKMEA